MWNLLKQQSTANNNITYSQKENSTFQSSFFVIILFV